MNGTHLHLLLNHFPIIGTLVAVLIMAWAAYKNDARLKNLTAVLIIALSVFAFIADQTGESAEETVEQIAGVNEAAMEAHEDAAGPAMIAHLLAGLFGIGFLVLQMRKLPAAKNVFIACFVLSVVAFGLMARAGWLGGQIRHTEINSAAPAPAGGDEGHNHND